MGSLARGRTPPAASPAIEFGVPTQTFKSAMPRTLPWREVAIALDTGAGSEMDDQGFTFSWDVDGSGKPVAGDGSDEQPFIPGLSTKALVRRLKRPPESFVLHVDATFKLNDKRYPVVVVGLQFRYVMGDAEKAQCNAFLAVFGHVSRFQYLMCFFHVMTNMEKGLKSFPAGTRACLERGLYDLHFARNQASFVLMRDALLQNWRAYEGLAPFCNYLEEQWLYGQFSQWQFFWTPSGYASTNNPVEQFNRVIKRDYTLRRLLKICSLLREP
ncbi:unnamed protein product [Phytophthora fragariaefolia]|uniref:Unnamed protein product n=1 Tax=Phytophthora fragariaefolia TaxID=1490495 RepID=A0A9W6UCD3_9STRA|nr:unnamed protein product [Phytophthora fragariaefolia]